MGNELFKNIPSKVGDLVKDVRNGRIGLPDLQRPFVWKDNKVRELFDSMLKGYPIGYIMLWESPADYESKKSTIGDNSKTYEEPKELVIDGQQRLTALVAAMFAVKVKDKNFADREIKISYNPLTREFAVWSQAYEKDTEWISRISDVFLAKEDNSISSLRRHFIREANEGRSKKEFPLLTDEEEDRIEDSINALLNLSDYSLPTLEISYNADEENVADIFVRVNSGGQSLTENNFIQTLISVYENETSDKINTFAAASRIPAANTSYNTLLAIEPSHLIRMAVGFGFKRARLKYAYMLLRGKNLETGKFSDEGIIDIGHQRRPLDGRHALGDFFHIIDFNITKNGNGGQGIQLLPFRIGNVFKVKDEVVIVFRRFRLQVFIDDAVVPFPNMFKEVT
ncbi:DUF262 domain-containing protein [uncultured Megasphaera sp.]|uniref:DUF262 domain-containing protein n=1 Tax=uncultured Megasphaera sp. TaxID=165188 RepID=UPI0025DC6A33|nr:DUF262 domain-containing protein [uncultured Megasphaera sp.]